MMKLNKKGFTLVELLAVIVILALLMVVAAGSIGSALDNSKKSALKTEAQKVLTSAAQDAVTENMLDSTKATTSSPLIINGAEGDYKWYIKATVSGGTATIAEYCVLYSAETSGETKPITYNGAYSLGSSTGLKEFTNLGVPKEKNKKGSCTITEETNGTTKIEILEADQNNS